MDVRKVAPKLRCEPSSETLILGYFKRRMLFTAEPSGNNIKTVVLWVLGWLESYKSSISISLSLSLFLIFFNSFFKVSYFSSLSQSGSAQSLPFG